ncbi:hypothetical protein NDN08_008054 [Rhodosorus marinus]|uniref:Peptidase M3A/M3B catalytic domain-containing protein n=1 Tax=Rhodosorus marinus TaxID=101924 RepID=A0AAV8V238_9RHOD|nr:hypothetical protein NDN08_008054 [Rhodosorus marinus]
MAYFPPLISFNRTSEEIVEYQTEIIEKNKQDLDELGAIEVWGEKELRLLGEAEMAFETNSSSCTFPMYVSTDAAVREAAAKAEVQMDAYRVEASQREDIYLAVRGFNERCEKGEVVVEPELKRWVAKLLRDFRRSGLELPKDDKDKLGECKKRISELCTEFSKNLNEDVTNETFLREELSGMPEPWLESLKKTEDGLKYYVTLKYPDMLPLMQRCKIAETRKRMDFLKGRMCQEANIPLFDEVLALRREVASLLGFDTFSDYALEIRMAKTADTVVEFLLELKEKLKPLADKELARLLELKKEECEATGMEFDGVVNSWDMLYYHTMLLDKDYQLDESKLQEYFPLDVVTKGMHEIYQTILGLRFEEVKDLNRQWHEDVQLFAVYDKDTGDFLGQFYLDMFPRDGKYGHAAVFGLQRTGLDASGKRQLPCCAMLCNFTPPTEDRPSLLKHREVETYFHEFGHVMHNICSEARVHSFACTRVERDFVEAPSQMLENWCYEGEPLSMMSEHYLDKTPLPDELLQAVIKSRLVDTGLLNLRQVFFGMFDMTCHRSPEAVVTETLWKELRKSISLIPQQEGCNPTAGFAHLMGGYESGYYGYLWSEVYSADLFLAFQGRFLDPTMGMRYRKNILAPGGSLDGMDMVRNFLGREPSQDAFLKHIGLVKA